MPLLQPASAKNFCNNLRYALTERRRLPVGPTGELRWLAQWEPLLHGVRLAVLGALLPGALPFLDT